MFTLFTLLNVSLEGLTPTLNQMYRNASLKVRYKTKKTREYQDYAVALMQKSKSMPFAFEGRVWVKVEFFVANKRKWDLDNRFKVLFDCLQLAEVIKDDSQIDFIYAERSFSGETKTVITVYGLEQKNGQE